MIIKFKINKQMYHTEKKNEEQWPITEVTYTVIYFFYIHFVFPCSFFWNPSKTRLPHWNQIPKFLARSLIANAGGQTSGGEVSGFLKGEGLL